MLIALHTLIYQHGHVHFQRSDDRCLPLKVGGCTWTNRELRETKDFVRLGETFRRPSSLRPWFGIEYPTYIYFYPLDRYRASWSANMIMENPSVCGWSQYKQTIWQKNVFWVAVFSYTHGKNFYISNFKPKHSQQRRGFRPHFRSFLVPKETMTIKSALLANH